MKHESKHKKHQPVADASVHSVHYTETEIASMKANQTIPEYFSEEDKHFNPLKCLSQESFPNDASWPKHF